MPYKPTKPYNPEKWDEIRAHVLQLIDGEDPYQPLTDKALAFHLIERGVKHITPHNTNYYRAGLGIPTSSERKCKYAQEAKAKGGK